MNSKKIVLWNIGLIITIVVIGLGIKGCIDEVKDDTNMYSNEIVLKDNATDASTNNYDVNGNIITIKEEGTYTVSGSLSDGQIIIDAGEDAKVELILDGVSVSTSKSAAIFGKNCKDLTITLNEGAENYITATGEDERDVDIDKNIDGAIFVAGDVTVSGTGTISIESEHGNGIVSKDDMVIENGNISINKSYEGLEAEEITINGGKIEITASDDGINVNEDGSVLTINDGYLHIVADGDGVDSNGDIIINGGETYVSGPVSDGDSAVDWGEKNNAVINGGILVAAGSSGMAEKFSDESTQGVILLSTDDFTEGEVRLLDSDNNELVSWLPEKKYSCVIISTPDIKVDSTYTVVMGDSETEVVMDTIVYGEGITGGSFGGGFMPKSGETSGESEPPNMGEMPEGYEPPNMGEMPEGSEPPNMGKMPEGGARQDLGNKLQNR